MVHQIQKEALQLACAAAAETHMQAQQAKAAQHARTIEHLHVQDIEDRAVLRLPFDDKHQDLVHRALAQQQVDVVGVQACAEGGIVAVCHSIFVELRPKGFHGQSTGLDFSATSSSK